MAERPGAGFGEQLRGFRTRAGLTQEQLAERAGLSVRGLSDLERGLKARPQFETLRLLADALALDSEDRAILLATARPSTPRDAELAASRGFVPEPPGVLIGRQQELAAVVGFPRGETRVLTLTGPGGTGKTRLALAAAAALAPDFPDGAWFVDLAPLADPALVPSAIATVLGVRADGGQPLPEALATALRDKRSLLVLDNFEHVLAAAPFVGELLAACRGLRVLVTSRAPLRLRAEREFPVPPLGLPRRKPPPTVAQLGQYDAVRLFVDRAVAVKPDFAVTNATAPAVAELCHRLDGLPLAIELAAARIRLFGPDAMLARLEQRLPLLTGGARDLPTRQQTLRGAIAWSHDLLTPDEQAIFRRVCVFAGGWTLAGAEAVAVADGATTSEQKVDVLAGSTALVEHSLVRRVEGQDGEPRFVLLETIREYGLEQLQRREETEATRERHARHLLTIAEQADLGIRGGSTQTARVEQLETEHDNLRAALTWALDHDPEVAVRLGAALGQFWMIRSYLIEGRDWLERILAIDGGVAPAFRADVLLMAGGLIGVLGDGAQAEVLIAEGLDIARALNDRRRTAAALVSLGVPFMQRGDFAMATTILEEGLALAREFELRWDMAMCLGNLGEMARARGDNVRAIALIEEGLDLARELDDSFLQGVALGNLASVLRAEGNIERAAVITKEALVLQQVIGDEVGIAYGLAGMAVIAAAWQQMELATRLLGASASAFELLGSGLEHIEQVEADAAAGAARTALGEAEFMAAFEAGRAVAAEDALAEALALTFRESA